MLDLWQLTVFCKVIELKSFSRAGEAIRLSQPTVSSHIKELETHFGTQLVDRLSRQTEPTRAGQILYDHAQRLLELRDRTEAAVSEFLGRMKGHLTIGGSTIPGGYLMPRLIGGFLKAYPEVKTTLIVADTAKVLDKVCSGQIEVAVVGARGDDSQLLQQAVAQDVLKVVVPADHPWAGQACIGLEALSKAPFIIRESGSGTLRSIEKVLRQHGASIRDWTIVAEMGSTEAIRQGVKSKVGVSILSAVAVADDVRAGELKTLAVAGIDLKRSFYLTLHKQRAASPICLAFAEFVRKEFGMPKR